MGQPQTELHPFKAEKLDACIKTPFTNPLTSTGTSKFILLNMIPRVNNLLTLDDTLPILHDTTKMLVLL